MEVLVVAAHPDDEVLGVGGTVSKHVKQGDNVYICIVAEGGTISYEKNLCEVLKESALNSAKILGVREVVFLGFPEQKLDRVSVTDINQSIEKTIVRISPRVLYTHHYGDLNKDHQIVFEATMVAARPFSRSPIKRILSYEVPSSTGWRGPSKEEAFIPNIYVDIKETFDKKLEAMKQYKTEIREYPHPRSIKALEAIAQNRGTEAGLELAEAFVLIREID